MSDMLFPRAGGELRAGQETLLDLIESCFPLAGRYRAHLGRDVLDLSRSLTDKRSDRDDGYLGKPAALSAYLRYFLPWNVYRLSRLLPALPLALADGDAVTDLGSGPLTFPIALWLSRPELRSRSLEFRCLDRTGKVLEAGGTLFRALAGAESPWRIRTIRGSLGARVEGPKAALVVAANVLNELFWDDRSAVAEQAERKAVFLGALARDDGQVLIVEPGIPRSGEFVSALRDAFIGLGRSPLAPCPHAVACPMPGGRGKKWCHFAFGTEDASERLHRLSAAAAIPKERATLSFVLAGPASAEPASAAMAKAKAVVAAAAAERVLPDDPDIPVRIISDSFALPDGSSGRYGCSRRGLTIVYGRRGTMEALESGTLIRLRTPSGPELRDPKTGALALSADQDRIG